MQIYAFFTKGIPDPVYDNYRKKLFAAVDLFHPDLPENLASTIHEILKDEQQSASAAFYSVRISFKAKGNSMVQACFKR